MKRLLQKKPWLCLFAGLYLLAVICAAALAGARAYARTGCTPMQLDVHAARGEGVIDNHPVSWAGWDSESLVTRSSDTYLVWQVNGPVSGLEMVIRSSQPVRDPQLYYTTAQGQDWSPRRTSPLKAADPVNGVYRFALPGAVSVENLRLDATISAGAFFELDAVTLNPAGSEGLLTAGEILLVLLVPLLAGLTARQLAQAFGGEKRRLSDFR